MTLEQSRSNTELRPLLIGSPEGNPKEEASTLCAFTIAGTSPPSLRTLTLSARLRSPRPQHHASPRTSGQSFPRLGRGQLDGVAQCAVSWHAGDGEGLRKLPRPVVGCFR